MDINRWNELLTVIECGSLTAAAQKMGYTLPSLSRNIALLEENQGFQLLHRCKQGVYPTSDCINLLPYIKELLHTEKCLEQFSASIRGADEGIINIGTAYRYYYSWIAEVTSAFRKLHPNVQFHIFNGTSTDFVQKLQDHQLDFCFISQRPGDYLWHPLYKDSLVALISNENQLSRQSVVSAQIFCSESYIETCPGLDIDAARFFHNCNIIPNTEFTTMDIQATYSMVNANLGISLNNRINIVPGYNNVSHIDIANAPTIEIGLACGSSLTPAAQAFYEFALDIIRS